MRKTVLLIIISFLLIGCVSSGTPVTILDDLVCDPPCWQGVIPGKTSEEEVLRFLSESPIIENGLIIRQDTKFGEFEIIHFELNKTIDPNGPTSHRIFLLDGKVAQIVFEWNLGVSLEQAISVFGNPERVIYENNTFHLVFFNHSRGIAYGHNMEVKFFAKWKAIHPNSIIDFIDFYDPLVFSKLMDVNMFGYAIDVESFERESHPWKGYGNILSLYPRGKSP